MPPILVAGTVLGVEAGLNEPITRAPHSTLEVVTTPRPIVLLNETVAVVGDIVALPAQVVLIQVDAVLTCHTGPGTTALTVRLYSGNAIVPANLLATVTFPVSNPIREAAQFTLRFVDQQGPGGTVQYTASVQLTAATGNGQISSSRLDVALQV